MQCEKELDISIPSKPSELVVEGWIESGKNPEVILSLSAPYFSEIDSATILDYAVTVAKVTVFTTTGSEILTLRPNVHYFPPLVYRGVETFGRTDSSYSIEIVYHGDTVTADTKIPDPVELDSVWFASDADQDSLGRVWISVTDDINEENYYRILFQRKGKDDRYIPPFTSVFNDKFFNGKTIELAFLRGYGSLLDIEQDNYFRIGDTISVKFCSIDKEQFDFWNAYQYEIITAANPFASSNFRIKSNINGGLGIWGGYSATYYTIIAK